MAQNPNMITDVATYFEKGCGRCARFDTPDCSTRTWLGGLKELRSLCLAAGLEEVAKWGQPVYMFAGRNVAILGAFRDNFSLSFFEPGLMKDPEGLLQKRGPNAQTASEFTFADIAQVAEISQIIAAYLAEAKSYAAQGLKAPKVERDLEWPEELAQVLDDDPILAEAFHALTPGRQKSYIFNLNGAKTAKTRFARMEKFRDKILAGKGALDR